MAIIPGGVFECSRGFLLHKVSGHRSGKASVSASSFSSSENGMGGKKGRRKTSGLSYRKGASNWWLPIFGWSPHQEWAEEKQEKQDNRSVESVQNVQHSKAEKSDENEEEDEIQIKRRSKSVPVRFTAEKAKLLRKTLRATSTYHELMYHSAIAARLASPDTYLEEEEEESRKGKP